MDVRINIKDFKAAIITTLDDIKENILLMNKTGNHNRGKESIERYQMEILKLKLQFIKKKSLYGLKSIINMIMEKVNEYENISTEITHSEEQRINLKEMNRASRTCRTILTHR